MKAGIAEIPDIAAVTKADLRALAGRTEADLRAALGRQPTRTAGWRVPIVLVSARDGQGIAQLVRALAEHHALLRTDGGLVTQRRAQSASWLNAFLLEEFGRAGLARAAQLAEDPAASDQAPFRRMRDLQRALQSSAGAPVDQG